MRHKKRVLGLAGVDLAGDGRANEGLQDVFQGRSAVADGCLDGVQENQPGFVQRSEIALEYGGNQAVFGTEVIVDRCQVHSSRFGDVPQRGPIESFFGEETFRHLKDLVPGRKLPGRFGHGHRLHTIV